MNINFLEKNQRKDKLILIFPGWSCGRELHNGFRFTGWDIAIVENYEEPSLDLSEIQKYSTVYLFAWSLGVYMASITDFGEQITSAFALNGTEIPADDLNGIPYEMFKKTADYLSPASLLKFRRRMAGSSTVFNQLFSKSFSIEETEVLQRQLHSIMEWQREKKQHHIPWKKVFLSENDAIFPIANLKRFWNTKRERENIEVISIEEGHYYPLEKMMQTVIPEPETVSRNFRNAKHSYDRQAIAQQKLAESLRELLKESGMGKELKVLEIGSGTGLFTKELLEYFSPRQLDLIDISDVHPLITHIPSTFFQHDAEEWIAEKGSLYDAIVSSATVQWFLNLKLFLKNVADRLTDQGILGFSTFLPGNLEELDSLRPSPLHYHSENEIIEWMKQYFDNIHISKSVFKLTFDSPTALLRHLKETGVAGSAPVSRIPLSKIRDIKTLTFHCVCFTGNKKPHENIQG